MQQNQQEDLVCIRVVQKLDRLAPSYECCIFRVHNELRELNNKAYEPNIIAIGPYHHGKKKLMMMEEHKLRYLRHHLGGNASEKLKNYVLALRPQQEEARRCYAEPLIRLNDKGESVRLDDDEWVEMMLLDGCFIIELVHEFEKRHLRRSEDPIFHEFEDPIFETDWIVNTLQRDLLLVENQLPFFVLCKLFDIIEGPNKHHTFVSRVRIFFQDLLPGPGRAGNINNGDMSTKYKHLLGVVYKNWLPSLSEERCYKKVKFILSVTELREAGIKFKKSDASNLFNIKFEDGELQIPPITIEDRTESFLRNLIAYEQQFERRHSYFVSDYVKFVDCLINSPNDVGVFCRKGIIDSWLGDDEEVSSMFNKLTKSVVGSGTDFHYNGVFEKINAHYGKRRNRWMAILRRNHLNSPWAVISVLAAILLLVLTFLQTIYTMKS